MTKRTMNMDFYSHLATELCELDRQGLTRPKRMLKLPLAALATIGKSTVFNLCVNNCLGFFSDQRVTEAAIFATCKWGRSRVDPRHMTHVALRCP